MRARGVCPLAISLFAAACGGDDGGPVETESEVRVVEGAPASGTINGTSALTAEAAVEALGSSSAGRVLAVAGAHTYEVGANALELRALYAGPGDPTDTGRVYSLTPRMEGGAWIAADAGLFMLDSLYVVKSPLVVGPGAVRDTCHVESGALAGLWIASDAGLFRHDADSLEKYPIEILSAEAIDAVAVAGDGAAALVLAGGELALLVAESGQIISDKPPLEAGRINAVAAGRSRLFAAGERGLLVWDGAWTRYTLAAAGGAAEEVLSVAIDRASEAVFARTRASLVRLLGAELAMYDVFDVGAGQRAHLAIDNLGDVWMGQNAGLERVSLGAAERVTFAAQVKPWITANCSRCHSNQTQNFEDYAVFREKAENALTRVRAGDMPRCDGGVPCADARLEPNEYSVLEAWIRDGKPE